MEQRKASKFINIGAIHEDNRQIYRDLRLLRNTKGKVALKAAHLKIVECVASFPKVKGCFMRDEELNNQSIRADSMKTYRLNVKFLLHIGVLVKVIEDGRRVFRIACPEGTVESQTEFRAARGMREYAYTKKQAKAAKNQGVLANGGAVIPIENEWDMSSFIDTNEDLADTENGAVFLSKTTENFSVPEAVFSAPGANFAPVLITDLKLTDKKEKLPPDPLRSSVPEVEFVRVFEVRVPESVQAGSLREPIGSANNRRPNDEAPSAPRNGEYESFSLSKENKKPEGKDEDDWAELLPKKPRGKIKGPKTQRERRVEALKRMNNGHVANPLGGPNTNPRKLNPKLARDIGPTGSITVAQLYRHLIKLCDSAFGEGVLRAQMPTSREGVSAMFDGYRQKFIECCQYELSNRELAEYFEWFLDSKRLQTVLGAAKYSSGKGFIHLKQLEGAVYLRRFYEEVLKKRKQKVSEAKPNATMRETQLNEIEAFIDEAYDAIRSAEQIGNENRIALAMVSCGYALAAQYFHDEHGMDASQCRQRIIAVMAGFIKRNEDPKAAVAFLRKGIKNTETCKVFLLSETCVWYNWEERTKDLIEVSVQQSGVSIDG